MPMSVHYSGRQALASRVVKQRLLTDFLAIVFTVPQAYDIMTGHPGRIDEELLSWEVVASKHQALR